MRGGEINNFHQCPLSYIEVEDLSRQFIINSRGLTYPTLGNGKSSSNCHFGGYGSSLEGKSLTWNVKRPFWGPDSFTKTRPFWG